MSLPPDEWCSSRGGPSHPVLQTELGRPHGRSDGCLLCLSVDTFLLFVTLNQTTLAFGVEATLLLFTTDVAGYDNSSYMVWKTPEMLLPSLNSKNISVGLNSELVEEQAAEERGYIVKMRNSTVELNIPYNAEGGYRKVRLGAHHTC